MSLRSDLRSRLTVAMKAKDEARKNILRVVLGEMDTMDARVSEMDTIDARVVCGTSEADDQCVMSVVRKLIESNHRTIVEMEKRSDNRATILKEENTYLQSLLPASLTTEEIAGKLQSVLADIRAAKSDGQATGIAMKTLKGEPVQGNIVSAVVKQLRMG